VRTSYSPDIATLDEHVSVEHDEEVPGELLVDSDSDNKLNPIDSENDDGEDETFVEDREILDPTEKEDDTAAVILSNARTVKEHLNSEQRCPPCPRLTILLLISPSGTIKVVATYVMLAKFNIRP
jgi:hypothetical protein